MTEVDDPNPVETTEDTRRGLNRTSLDKQKHPSKITTEELPVTTDKIADEGRKSSDKQPDTLETIDQTSKSVERTKTSSTAKGSIKSSDKQPEVPQTFDEFRKNLETSLRTSDTVREGRRSSINSPDILQTIAELRKSLDRTPRASLTAEDSRAGAEQQRMSLGSAKSKSVDKPPDNTNSPTVPVTSPTVPPSSPPTPQPHVTSPPTPQPRVQIHTPERPVPAPRQTGLSQTTQAMQNQVAYFFQRWVNFLPPEYRGEMWVYAAGYVFLYSLVMLFSLSTFGFICMGMYVLLFVLLALRYFGIGPLVSHRVRS